MNFQICKITCNQEKVTFQNIRRRGKQVRSQCGHKISANKSAIHLQKSYQKILSSKAQKRDLELQVSLSCKNVISQNGEGKNVTRILDSSQDDKSKSHLP